MLDTNVVLSALVFSSGPSAQWRSLWQNKGCLPLVCKATVEELVRVLAYPKFGLDAASRDELLGEYLPYAEVVRIAEPPPQTPPCRDPFDVPFLQLALAGKAQALVSGDKDLLALAGQLAVPIVTPQAWLRAQR